MDRPPFPVAASAVAEAPSWQRGFGHPSVRNWGTRGAPAPTCSLVHGEWTAVGVAHLIERRFVEAIISREASEPINLAIEVENAVEVALTWPMTTPWADWDIDRLARAARTNIAAGGGPMGDALDYVSGVVAALTTHDRSDPLASNYLEAVETAWQRDGWLKDGG